MWEHPRHPQCLRIRRPSGILLFRCRNHGIAAAQGRTKSVAKEVMREDRGYDRRAGRRPPPNHGSMPDTGCRAADPAALCELNVVKAKPLSN